MILLFSWVGAKLRMNGLSLSFARSIYTKTVRSIRARAKMPENVYASRTPEKLPDGSLIFDLKANALKPESYANCPTIPCRSGRVLGTFDDTNFTISNKNSLTKLSKQLNLSRSFLISRQSPEKREQLRAEEEARIEKLSVRQKKGLLMRRLISLDRMSNF
jgi:hypothetical protein